jgi:hypothetical protein
MVNRSAGELAKEATGNIKKKHLTKDSGMVFTYLYDGPLIEHLDDDEQPEYVFSHGGRGYQIIEQNGDESTPHHDTMGKKYLLVTDQRVLCVAGCDDGDETIEHSYGEIVDIEASGGKEYSKNIHFRSVDGKTYKFAPQSSNEIINEAIRYVSERATGTEPGLIEDGLSNIDSNSIRNDNVPKKISKLDSKIDSDETVHYAYPILSSGQDDTDEVVTDWCLLATDERLMLYDNEKIASFNYGKIVTVKIENQANLTALSVQSTSKSHSPLAVFHNSDINKSELEEFFDFIRNKVSDSDTETVDINEKIGLSNIDINKIQNDDVPKNILELDDSIKPDETVHYAYGINAAKRGDDQMGGYTTGGCLLATDERLTAYINETIGSSNISISYDKIDTVEIEHGAVTTKLSVQSTSKTYTFPGFNNIDKSEIHDFADFIRDKASEPETDETSESNIDPTEQLKNIKELHDQGVLTDEEFEEKKQSLLDKL